LAHAIDLAKRTDAELIIMHVLSYPIPPIAEMTLIDQETWDRIFASAQSEAHRQVDAIVARARDAGVQASGFVIDGGMIAAPADEIVRAAKEKEVAVLVLGTHGRTGVAKLFLGSVTVRVVATAPCPVFTVRAPESAE
jgi:nucleotide-binding universal stress UspA family protein